ncbi:MAG: hypothetical protein V1915_02675 [Candidatus Bathyarchaeota archaeon]
MKTTGWEKYLQVDKRIIWSIWLLIMFVALVRPIGFPGVVSPYVQKAYDFLMLQPAGTICCSSIAGFTSFLDGNQWPSQVAVTNVLFRQHFRIVFIGTVDAANNMDFVLDPAKKQIDTYGAVYGVDYVVLGPVQAETTYAGLYRDIWGYLKGVDMYGNKFSDLSLMAEVHTAKDFQFAYYHAGAESLFDIQLRQQIITYRTPTIGTGPDAMASYIKQFVQSGDLVAGFSGASGAAEFERLSGIFKQGTALQDAYALTVIFFIAIVILANVPVLAKMSGRK